MAAALLEWETIDADQINDIMEGKPPRPPKPMRRANSAPPPAASDGAPDRAGRHRPTAAEA